MDFESLIRNLQITHNTLNESAAKAINIAMTVRNWLYGFYIVEYEQNGEDRAAYGERLIRTLEKQLKDLGQKGMSFTNLNMFRQFYHTYPHIGNILPAFLNSLGIIQAAPEQSSGNTDDQIIQTLSEQSPGIADNKIREVLPDKFRPFDINTIQLFSENKSAEPKPGLNPTRLLQTLSFSHLVELIKIEDSLKRAFYEIECVKAHGVFANFSGRSNLSISKGPAFQKIKRSYLKW
jgi:hypothetical protein